MNDSIYDSKPWLAHYAEGVPHEAPTIPYSSMTDFLNQLTKKFASRKAFTLCLPNGLGGTLTYEQLEKKSDALATYLRKDLKLQPGDRVAIQTPNCLAYPVISFGVFKAGCVLVNVNPLYTPEEMQHQLSDSGAQVLFLSDLFGDKASKIKIKHCISVSLGDLCLIAPLIQFKLKMSKQIPATHAFQSSFAKALALGAQKIKKADLDLWKSTQKLTSTAVLQYTGGTTGVSKGAELTHFNLLSNMAQILSILKPISNSTQHTVLTALPMYHVLAFTVNLLALAGEGSHNIIIPSPRPLKNMAKAFARYPFTLMTGVNTLYNGLLLEPWFVKNPPRYFRVAVSGGMALQSAVAKRWIEATKSPILEGFGLTESSPVLTMQPLGGKTRNDSIGLPVPGTEMRIVDDNGVTLPVDTPGEVIAKGPQIMKGYWNRDIETRGVLRNGWLYTGDIGTMDKDGYFKIVDRKKNMIIVSGFNVYPNEVEDVIMQMPNIKEVAIIGIPDNSTGESVKAFVVVKEGTVTLEEIRSFCKQHLTSYKIPKHLEFRDELPKTPVGKILHKELRKPA